MISHIYEFNLLNFQDHEETYGGLIRIVDLPYQECEVLKKLIECIPLMNADEMF